MYAHIDGVLAEKGEGMVVIDAGGVGYLLSVSAETLSRAPATGERFKCYTWLSVREDAMELYGFYSREEKRMFERLRAVSGVGPKSAIQILSALSVSELALALVTGDATALSRAPGVGKKTAQRLILELKDKVSEGELTGGVRAPARAADGGAAAEAIEALMALGYQASEAAAAVASVNPAPDRADELVRLALRGMFK